MYCHSSRARVYYLPVPGSQMEIPLIRRLKEKHTMRVIVRFRAIALGLAITVTGCASPPNADVDAAKAALDRAATDRAGQYAAESLKAAQDAQAALDAELKAQEGKWFKSYDKTKELAVAAKAAGDKAAADAVAGKEKADAVAAKEKAVPPRPGRRPRWRRSASGVRSSHQTRSRTSSRYTPPLRGRRVSPGRSRSKRRLDPTGKSWTRRSCARSRCSIRPRLTPCGSGSTRRLS